MGNQNRTEERSRPSYHDQIEILRWRANLEHNTHIARTLILPRKHTRSMAFQNVITSQLSQHPFIDLTKLQEKTQGQQSRDEEGEILVFEDYAGSLVGMEDCLSIEENIYILIALLTGYEQIFKKYAFACVHPACCHITHDGEVRAWINSDPNSCQPDHPLLDQLNQQGKPDGPLGRVLCSTEASVCKSVIEVTLQLSVKDTLSIQFYRAIDCFIRGSMLQNLNFVALRTFINGFVFRQRINIPNNILPTLRAKAKRDVTRSLAVLPGLHSNKKTASQHSLSLKQDQIEPPFEHQQASSIISEKPALETSQLSQQSHPSRPTHKRSLTAKHPSKSVQTSCFFEPEEKHGFSTQAQTPKKTSLIGDNELICSEIIIKKGESRPLGFNKSKVTKMSIYNKENELSKLSQRMNLDEDEQPCPVNSTIFKPNHNSSKKLVRFHSHNPTFDDDHSSLYFNTHPEKEVDCTHYSLTHSRNPLQNSPHSTPFVRRHQRQLTKVVSNLVSNNEIDLCESVGSFQSLERSDGGYSGVLLGMGRSVEVPNSLGNNRSGQGYRGFSSIVGQAMAHATF